MSLKEDLALSRAVSEGEANACKCFVDDYTDLVLSKVWNLMKTHCNYPARERVCSLVILQKKRRGAVDPDVTDQCDECIDSYIWFFDYLKKKVGSYKGSNNCSLRTFIWSIINSHSTYIDWLRWKYGRAY